jgi:translation initiation factor IF-3
VRLIDAEGNQVGVISRDEALKMAKNVGLDLVEISAAASPPVCRLIDYGKFKYDQEKKQHAAKRKQKQIQVKEVKIRPSTEEGDYQVKLRNLRRFLEHGDKAKVTVRFRGREIAHQEIGMKILERIKVDLADCCVVEANAKREGRQLIMVLAPKKSQ